MGAYDLGPRLPRLFLAVIPELRQPHLVVWKEGSTLCWIWAGFLRTTTGSVQRHETARAGAQTVDSIAEDLRIAFQRADAPVVRDCSGSLGFVYPRIFRPEIHEGLLAIDRPTASPIGRHAIIISAVAAAQLLFDDLEELFAYVEPDQQQLPVYGHKPRQLLLLACMEVDSALKSIAQANGSTTQKPRIKDHAQLSAALHLREWEVRLNRSVEGLTFTPFENWSPQNYTLPWYTAYNETKHVLNAVAAVYVLLESQFGSEARQRLRHCPFAIVHRPNWDLSEVYVPSPFEGPHWQCRSAHQKRRTPPKTRRG
jgi:hypothetical protein